MAPPKYKDLGKKANDILNEDFKFEKSFELNSKIRRDFSFLANFTFIDSSLMTI
jgi:hypothetical protein